MGSEPPAAWAADRRRTPLPWRDAAARTREETTVLFESPHRILKTLEACTRILPDRPICVARELTKQFEEYRRGVAAELLAHYTAHPAKGEIALVIAGAGAR
jgi:16S rRNA (cytidine1402-2'-O)-methyltransferase